MARKRTSEKERMAAFVRLAKRLKRAGRDSPTGKDYGTVAREYDVSSSTLRTWCSRYPDAWERAQVAVGLVAQDAQAVGTGETSGEGGNENAVLDGVTVPAPGLTPQQAEACRLRTLRNRTQVETATAVGCHYNTIGTWEKLPAWQLYRDELELRRHELTLDNLAASANRGGVLRLRVMGVIEAWLDGVEGGANVVDTEDIKRIGDLVDRLATSAEDRAGYPRSERRELEGEVGVRTVQDMSDEELMKIAQEAEDGE